MRRRQTTTSRLTEYPRPVIPAGLTEDQEDELLHRMMDRLLAGSSDLGAPPGVELRSVDEGDWSLDDDVVEF